MDYKNAQTSIESKTRALTEHESAQCPAPINVPPPQVLEGDWETTSTLCYLGVVRQMREVTTIEFGLVNGEVVETNRTVVKEYRDRTMNEDELAACPDREDPTVEPPPDTKPKPDPEPVKMPTQTKVPAAPAPKAQVQQLPRTGSSSTTAALLASGLLVAGIGSLAASRRLRRAQR